MKHYCFYLVIIVSIILTSSCERSYEKLTPPAQITFNHGYSDAGEYIKSKEIKPGANFIDISVNVASAGSYSITTNTINGYKFSGQGELKSGTFQMLRLTASGTPQNSGTDEFKVQFGESSFTFSVEVVPFSIAELDGKFVITAIYNDWYDYGKLTAYKAATGAVAWSSEVTGYITRADVNKDTIFINNSGKIEARNINTGGIIWSREIGGTNGLTYYKGVLYCSTNGGTVLALKSSDGSLVHSFSLESSSVVSSVPVIADDVMYVGHDDLWAYNINGSLKWKYTLPGFSRSGPTVVNGIVYISTDNGMLCAVNTSDGSLKWQYAAGTNGEECPTVLNGKVYTGNTTLFCLNATDGQLVWRKDNLKFEWDSPDVFNNIVYVGSQGTIYSLNAATGVSNWEKQGYYISSQVAANEYILVYNTADLVVRYAENGEILWIKDGLHDFDDNTLEPFIYDATTKTAYFSSIYGNKR